MKDYKFRDTRFGFIFNGTSVERISVENGDSYIGIFAPRESMILRITKGGKIKINDHNRKMK